MTQNAFDKTNTLPKKNNCAEYTMIYIHCLVWGIVLEISNEIAAKSNEKRAETYNI